MPLNFTDVLYRPVFMTLATTLSIVLTTDEVISLAGIDESKGLLIEEQHAQMGTYRPTAVIRMRDLTDLGHVPEDLQDATMDMNGVSWIVKSYYAKASPNGERDGELYLILNEAT